MSKSILDLTAPQARLFFLESKNYCNFDLPKYFTFTKILSSISSELAGKSLSSYQARDPATLKLIMPNDIEGINHKILTNKDGRLAWRPFELINPVLYVDLVHYITEPGNWSAIQKRFSFFKKSNVLCESIPRASSTKRGHKAEQITWWWEHIEQESIQLGLEFSYILDADITDCYGSIYTHSIAWALHGKRLARDDRRARSLIGSGIDSRIQAMRYRQTNGIPQGNAVSDLIAEIVLGYADTELSKKIKARGIKTRAYKIIRYRDDYRIFTNSLDDGREIMKALAETTAELGLKLNTAKTKESSDPILSSLKDDKIAEMFIPTKEKNWSKWLMQIYASLSKHPNSGQAARLLRSYHSKLLQFQNKGGKLQPYEKPLVLIATISNMAITNPKYYNWCAAILSIFLEYVPRSRRKLIANKVLRKFVRVPNTGILDIWLQRVIYPSDPTKNYNEPLTKVVVIGSYPGNDGIWPSSWLTPTMKAILKDTPIVDKSSLKKARPIITSSETDLFASTFPS